jgi:hypothetical protein
MFDKFNFYDFLAYVLPGAAAIFVLYFVAKTAFGLPLPGLPTDLGGSVVFLGASYLAGHLVQGVGSLVEDHIDRSREPTSHSRVQLGERLLLMSGRDALDESSGLPNPVRERIKTAATEVFGANSEARIFDLCRALIANKGLSQRTDIYEAQRGLARGMFLASSLGVLAAAVVALQQLLAGSALEAGLSATAVLILVVIGLLFLRGFFRFRDYFARSVYWAFLAWYGDSAFVPATATARS